MPASRSNVSPLAARNRRRLRPTPAVLLTSSKADLLPGWSPAGAAPGIRHRYAYNESGRADMVLLVNIWIAGIYSKCRENIGKDARKSVVLDYLFGIRRLLPTSSPNAAFRDVDFYK